jgi:hypothetical protein
MAVEIQADKIGKIILSRIQDFEHKRVPAVEPFKPLSIRY